jgi:Lrp/AsnC family transcriptional regulator for asnA, asnC and gidA
MPRILDDIDLALIETLRKNGRTPSKTLARSLGVAETTVASRIRQLREDKVMLVTLRRDLYSKGFDLQCFADVFVAGRSVDAVAEDLARIAVTSSVTLMLGTPEIIVAFNAIDREDLLRVLEEDIPTVDGVVRIELHTAVDIRKYQMGFAKLDRLE